MTHSTARVTATTDLTLRLRRVQFHVPDLARLALPGDPDEAVGIYFPLPGETATPEMECRNGVWGYHDPESAPEARNYSVRAIDHATGTMTVDFVVHSHGPATAWAQRAELGHQVVMAHARGWYRPPPTQWRLLAADLAGLPALARILQEDNGTTSTIAVVEVPAAIELDYLDDVAHDADIVLVPGSGNGIGPSVLAETMRHLTLPAGPGYCWFAGEAAESRAVRKWLRNEHHWRRESYDTIGYWRSDGEEWSRRYAAYGDELFDVYQGAIAAGKGEKAAAEEFDEALERRGL
ncbi:siderophore-interacting protein [Gordonia tangerina]|uniref:Siderophore-interacting protein n=1 Tax=Gordonia tangerina TaxID=2911060 RepID=A0ABS9DK48_9ACTN|nr:siderophore-interacting protein [Gordonia tangerina]MCF3939595.1 siderophore-interacting protein [Gordonia tangerina]